MISAYLISGIVLGLSGGLTPGPLMVLVISETLKHGVREGVKVSVSPLLTDGPISLVAIVILSQLSNLSLLVGTIYIFGGLFLLYLTYESLWFHGADMAEISEQIIVQSFKKGVITNFLNPIPYMFWISVGAPEILNAWKVSVAASIGFVMVFYLFLIGSKVLVAVLVGKSKTFLKSTLYIYAVRFLGIVLFFFALLFFTNGLKSFGVI